MDRNLGASFAAVAVELAGGTALVPALIVVFAYLAGSIPSGLWLARLAGVDVRASGSGNIGATNVGRTAGLRLGLLTLVFDVAKGAVPVLIARATSPDDWFPPFVGLTAFYGHIFSLFAGLRGGKGVATAAGAFLALAPAVLGSAALVFALLAFTTRIVSLASIAAALTLPAAALLGGQPQALSLAAGVAAATIVLTHRQNIGRLLRGAEPRFSVRSGKS